MTISDGRLQLKSDTAALLTKRLPSEFTISFTHAKTQWTGHNHFKFLKDKNDPDSEEWLYGAHGTWWTNPTYGDLKAAPKHGLFYSVQVPGTFPRVNPLTTGSNAPNKT